MKEINLCIVAGTHGDEHAFGSLVQGLVKIELPGQAYMLTGNPRAVAANRRFVDSDLNRAFAGDGQGYEAERAEEIRGLMESEGFTHVVDLHTSPTTHSIVPIIPKVCKGEIADTVINTMPAISNVVELPAADKPYSLVSAAGRAGIALECPRYREIAIAKQVARGLIDVIKLHGNFPLPRSIFEVIGLISEDVDLPGQYVDDFKPLPNDLGLAFVADPSIYKQMGYGHQGMRVAYKQERNI